MNFNLVEADIWLDKSQPIFWLTLGYSLLWFFLTLSFLYSSHFYQARSKWRTIGVAAGIILMSPVIFYLIPWVYEYMTWAELRNDNVNLAIMISDKWLLSVGMLGIFLLASYFRRKKIYNANTWETLALNPVLILLFNAFFPGCLYPFKGYSWLGFLLTFSMPVLIRINYLYSIVLYLIIIILYFILPKRKNKALAPDSQS